MVEPFVEEAKKAIVPEELRALSEGIRKVGKDQGKFSKKKNIKVVVWQAWEDILEAEKSNGW